MKRLTALVSALFITSLSSLLSAQNCTVAGVVTDKANEEPLIGATVTLQGASVMRVSTDLDGAFNMMVAEGKYQMIVAYIGYQNDTISITASPGKEIMLPIRLEEFAGLLNTVVVTGSKFEKKIGEETVTIDVIKTDLIEHTNDFRLDQTDQRGRRYTRPYSSRMPPLSSAMSR